MNTTLDWLASLVLAGLAALPAIAQSYVTPKLGGGQVAAEMVHIDIFYDAEANRLDARVDDSLGLPELRPLSPEHAFDPLSAYAVLNGKAYNAQYGWNVGGFFTVPPGAAIWIEQIDASPGLETYEGWGRAGSHAPLFGTASAPLRWLWSGVMAHNTYAVLEPVSDRFVAEYHVYFGDPTTGSRAGFEHCDDAAVRLEWSAVPIPDTPALRLGAVAPTYGVPLSFLNAKSLAAPSGFVAPLRPTAPHGFECPLRLLAVPATTAHGGPAPQHAAVGACIEIEFVSLTGPPGARLSVRSGVSAEPLFTLGTGERHAAHRIRVSQHEGAAGADPFGQLAQHTVFVDSPGLYALGFRLIDTSSNGPDGGPIHVPSEVFEMLFQGGWTIATIARQGDSIAAAFAAERGKTFHLERAAALGPAAEWHTVAGPVKGDNHLVHLTDPGAIGPRWFYRLRVDEP